MDRVLDEHRQQANQRPIVPQAVRPQSVGHRPIEGTGKGQLAKADRSRADASATPPIGSLTPTRLARQKTSASRSRSRQSDRCPGVSPSAFSRSRDQEAGSRNSVTVRSGNQATYPGSSSPLIVIIPTLSSNSPPTPSGPKLTSVVAPTSKAKPFLRKYPAQPPGWPCASRTTVARPRSLKPQRRRHPGDPSTDDYRVVHSPSLRLLPPRWMIRAGLHRHLTIRPEKSPPD